MAMDQKAREVVEKTDSCHDLCEMFRIAKGLQGRNILGLVVLR